ncbi:hypothetical protein SAY87_012750 [Trapa incisa]|uniref:Uncharacterized protein n=1 Tax=Trapa incisa TaxID=236973 RepID=A0AAN7JKF8_9MYRT|nr:hypothetical protein SAY87_012750 [Trapa incisa]
MDEEKQRRWAESDAEFLQWVVTKDGEGESSSSPPEIYEGFNARQKYLKSYTFKKKSMADKTMDWVKGKYS